MKSPLGIVIDCIDLPHPSQFTEEQKRFAREVVTSPEIRLEFRRAIHEMSVCTQHESQKSVQKQTD